MNSLASAVEVNFDCLVGPTHHFGGLSMGNLASTGNKARISHPKKAALQGLNKMKYLYDRGFHQAVLPPHPRPHMPSFHNLGFLGPDIKVLADAYQKMPEIFLKLCSSSAMWAANAATISPARDTSDNRLHITPSNLITMLHRCIEPQLTYQVFKKIFFNEKYFMVHKPLLAHDLFSDEGAANHNRLCPRHGERGIEIFVYGRPHSSAQAKTHMFPCRQTLLANEAIITRHQLDDNYVFNIAQNPIAIDKGAFHNDVVCVVNENVILCHSLAFVDQALVLAEINERYYGHYHDRPVIIEIDNDDLSLEEAIKSYLFNSQLISKPDGCMMLIAPQDCLINPQAQQVIKKILSAKNPIDEVYYFDISESMANGGGPACLRLRVVMNETEIAHLMPSVFINEKNYTELSYIINKLYVDDFSLELLFDEKFLAQSHEALAAITKALEL